MHPRRRPVANRRWPQRLLAPGGLPHNYYAEPDAETGELTPGTPIDRLLGFRWNADAGRWEEIPFQVDERFTRYLDNSASGFSPYSGQDQHTTYAYDGPNDREGFRWYGQDPDSPCLARPVAPAAGEVGPSDPGSGFDTNDEVAFMASDAGPAAPAGTPLPRGIEAARQIAVTDPAGLAAPSFVYLMRAEEDGPRQSFDASNGYVRYERDANADVFHFSQSSYDNYGNARKGKFWDPATGNAAAPIPAPSRPRSSRRARRSTARASPASTTARSAAARSTPPRSPPTATSSATTAAG